MKRIEKLEDLSIEKLRRDYVNEHSKFIHASWLRLDDLHKNFYVNNQEYKIIGLWEVRGYRREILCKQESTEQLYIIDSKEVSKRLGYKNMRRFSDGVERPFAKTSLPFNVIDSESDLDEIPNVWVRLDEVNPE